MSSASAASPAVNRFLFVGSLFLLACSGSTDDLVGNGFGRARLDGCFRFDKPYFSGETILRFTSDNVARQIRSDSLEFAVRVTQPEVDSAARETQAMRTWRPAGDRDVVVAWRNGLSGPVFRLTIHGDTLRGRVRQTTDVHSLLPNPSLWWKSAHAVRVACPMQSD